MRDAVLVLSAFLVTSVALIYLYRRLVDRPIRELIQVMTDAPAKDFLVRASVKGKGAIGLLSQSFNRLLERITTLDAFKLESERQLVMVQQELKFKEALEEKGHQIEKANRELEARLKELSLLYEFSQEASMTLELDELYAVVERFLGDKLGFKEFAFLVYDEETRKVVVKIAHGFFDEERVLGMSFQPGEGVTGKVLAVGEALYIPDTRQCPDYLYYKRERRDDGSFLSVPLKFKNKVVGVLNMFRPAVEGFSKEEIHFLSTLVVELAIALSNAKLYSRTRELSVRDELTQLYNRRHFQEVLPLEIKRAERFERPFTLLMIDIDHFKKFNDRYGHLKGDACLKEFVHAVNVRIREVDFFARFGGEEFVMLLPNTPKKDGIKVAEKIRNLVRDHLFQIGGGTDERPHEEHLTVSIGLAAFPDDAKNMEDLIDAADSALYGAKRGGRDRVVATSGVADVTAEKGRSAAIPPREALRRAP